MTNKGPLHSRGENNDVEDPVEGHEEQRRRRDRRLAMATKTAITYR
jgi:hypothetical protein